MYYLQQYRCVIIFKVTLYPKPCPQRSSKQTAARGGPYQCERLQSNLNGACSRTFVQHYVNGKIFHGRIQVFFNHRRQTMDLIYKKNVSGLQSRKQPGQIAGFVQYGTRCYAQSHSQFVSNDMGKGGLAQSRRAMQQYVVQRISPQQGRLHEYLKIVGDLVLTGKLCKLAGSYLLFKIPVNGLFIFMWVEISHRSNQ